MYCEESVHMHSVDTAHTVQMYLKHQVTIQSITYQ